MSDAKNPFGGGHMSKLQESRQEVAAQVAKIAALQLTVATLRAEIERKDASYCALARENEEHAAAASKAVKDLARERARAFNLESALASAGARIKSLEESCRRMLAKHDHGAEQEARQ